MVFGRPCDNEDCPNYSQVFRCCTKPECEHPEKLSSSSDTSFPYWNGEGGESDERCS